MNRKVCISLPLSFRINPVPVAGFFMAENSELESLLKALKNMEESVQSVTETPQKQASVAQEDDQTATEEQQVEDHERNQDNYLESINLQVIRLRGEMAHLRTQGDVLKANAESTRTDNDLRRDMANKTFGFMEKWCIFVALVVFIYFCKKDANPPTEVILALLGTCTISIIGLVGFVVSGLFKSGKPAEQPKDK